MAEWNHESVWGAIDALAARHGLSPSGLARKAGLDPTAFNPSKRHGNDRRPRWPSTESIAKVLAATGETLDSFVGLARRKKRSSARRRETQRRTGALRSRQLSAGAAPWLGAGRRRRLLRRWRLSRRTRLGRDRLPGSPTTTPMRSRSRAIRCCRSIATATSSSCRPRRASGAATASSSRPPRGEVMAKILKRQSATELELASFNPGASRPRRRRHAMSPGWRVFSGQASNGNGTKRFWTFAPTRRIIRANDSRALADLPRRRLVYRGLYFVPAPETSTRRPQSCRAAPPVASAAIATGAAQSASENARRRHHIRIAARPRAGRVRRARAAHHPRRDAGQHDRRPARDRDGRTSSPRPQRPPRDIRNGSSIRSWPRPARSRCATRKSISPASRRRISRRCAATVAAAWPCGRLARAALRSFIHSRAIDCEIPEGAAKIPDPATCFVGGENMSEWLVAQGWAKRSGDDFADVEKKAKQAKLGLWSAKRPDQPTAVAAARRLSQLAGKRSSDQRPRLGNAVDRDERAEARAALLADAAARRACGTRRAPRPGRSPGLSWRRPGSARRRGRHRRRTSGSSPPSASAGSSPSAASSACKRLALDRVGHAEALRRLHEVVVVAHRIADQLVELRVRSPSSRPARCRDDEAPQHVRVLGVRGAGEIEQHRERHRHRRSAGGWPEWMCQTGLPSRLVHVLPGIGIEERDNIRRPRCGMTSK